MERDEGDGEMDEIYRWRGGVEMEMEVEMEVG